MVLYVDCGAYAAGNPAKPGDLAATGIALPIVALRLRVPTRFVLKYTLTTAHLELGGVDLDLAVEDDVLPLDRADVTQQVGVEREVRRGGQA